MIRLLVRADAPVVRRLYQAVIAGGGLSWWPVSHNDDLSLSQLRREIEAANALPLGYFDADGTLRGFFLVRRGAPRYVEGMPEDYSARKDAWELWLSVLGLGLSNEDYKAGFDALFNDGWFARIRGQLAWARGPRDTMPKRMLQYADNRFAHYEYEQGGVTWTIWIHEA